jgi:hypothetical protein
MTPQVQLTRSIQEAVSTTEVSLTHSWTWERRAAVIELVRVMDLQRLSSKEAHEPSQSDGAIDWLYVNGYPRALQLFMDESTAKHGYPLFPSTPRTQSWAASTLQQAGRIQMFRRVLSWCRQGLAALRPADDGVLEVLIPPGSGVEAVERDDYRWFAGMTTRIQQSAMQSLQERQEHIDGLMIARVRSWRRHFIGYESNVEIDRHYQALGVLYSQQLVGQDSFPGAATFDGLPFDLYRSVTATLIGWAMKHVSFCNLLKRKNATTVMANVVTIGKGREDLIRDLADALQIERSEALRALDILVISHESVLKHYAFSAGPAPPLLAIGDGFLLQSAYGWQSEPYVFMLSGLCRNYRSDWDGNVGLREEMFRSELYDLFRWVNLITLRSGCKLRSEGRVVTDVDAVVFHPPTRTAGLFQLKWQDLFGDSMEIRRSRQTNLRRETSTWLNSVVGWLSARSGQEKARGLGLDRFGASSVTQVETFVLGRHFAHFSGSEADDRAAWGMWPQVLRLFATAVSEGGRHLGGPVRVADDMTANPIKWLAESLRRDSPWLRLPAVKSLEEERVQLGGVSLLIRSA